MQFCRNCIDLLVLLCFELNIFYPPTCYEIYTGKDNKNILYNDMLGILLLFLMKLVTKMHCLEEI